MTDLSKTIEHIKVLVGAGCTKFPEYVDLDGGYIHNTSDHVCGNCPFTYCPEACHAAIIAWCGEVCKWWNQHKNNDYRSACVAWGRYTKWDNDLEEIVPDGSGWRWKLHANEIGGREPTQLAACLALIDALRVEIERKNNDTTN